MSSAGLIMLQDALEIVFLAMLIERDVDEKVNLESKSFDELIGELKKVGVSVPKSGTLKALNKQRVITKHYGQLAEPLTVDTYAEAADNAVDSIVRQVIGRGYREIFLVDLLAESEAKRYLSDAAALLDENRFLDSLVAIRKAIYVEIEVEYCIRKWADSDQTSRFDLFLLSVEGSKAPSFKRNREWIRQHVHTPFEFIQIDHERLRVDAIEWGVNTSELENIRRLTPEVFRIDKEATWQLRYELQFPANEANGANARYCLDRAISVLLRKQQHSSARRWPKRDVGFEPPTIYLEAPVFSKARQDSEVVHRIDGECIYTLTALVSGFDPTERYYMINGHRPVAGSAFGSDWFYGFLLLKDEYVSSS